MCTKELHLFYCKTKETSLFYKIEKKHLFFAISNNCYGYT